MDKQRQEYLIKEIQECCDELKSKRFNVNYLKHLKEDQLVEMLDQMIDDLERMQDGELEDNR